LIPFGHKALVVVLRRIALTPLRDHSPQEFEFAFVAFKQAQTCTDHLWRRANPSFGRWLAMNGLKCSPKLTLVFFAMTITSRYQ